MGSKKHKKHHKSDKKDISFEDRQEKPLKLVLKVGGSVQSPLPAANSGTPQVPRISQEVKPVFEDAKMVDKSSSHSHEKHKKSKKKKKKKSTEKDKERHERKRKHHHHHHHHREHSHDRKEKRRKDQDSNRLLMEGYDSRDSLPLRTTSEVHPLPVEKPTRDARTCTLKRKAQKSPLQILLYHLLKKLQLKDPQEFFAWPVTDVIAPGYSSIISKPIDFSTINKKIDDREYKSVAEFKADVKLMCDNAMTYNRPDTVYYKSAKRMWHYAQKLMNRDQLMCLKRTFPYMLDLSVDELGFDINDES
ncbi:Bromodomain-containing protein 7, partial [Stegodyphus mimosarum]